ncbi:hypothetical protein [uncultured Roseobacter sp.]|uniref:hypothetical protein n=1 Tax=uncultured Roseobacter sp. TaxID=114847 RepID=UPI00262A4FA6|nr:hypothetical protein [uncultured Roseobacter sp.]
MTKQRSIIIPRNLTNFSAVANLKIREIDLDGIDRCIISFVGTSFAEPLPMIALASDLRNLRTRFPHVTYVCRSRETAFRGYADHIGYFRFLGFSRGNQIGDASGSGNYVPIHLFDINKLKANAGDEPYGKIVSEESLRLAEVLTQSNKGGLFVAVEYAIREVFRNAVEHGMGSKAALLGQYWPTKEIAEIVICDNGVGIAETLKDYYDTDSPIDALSLSLNPGISGTSDLEREHQNPYYRNSGFGLYTTSTFCAEHGLFRVISGDAGVTRQSNNLNSHNWSFDGTCVQMKIRTSDLNDSAAKIQRIVEKGEEEAGARLSASTASKQTSLA